MDSETEREAITEAMARLFAGAPIRSSGNLDILTLAEEAGLKPNKLPRKHTDLRDAFYAERARREGVSEREIRLREQIADMHRRLDDVRVECDKYRAAAETFARAMNVLTQENGDLRKQLDKTQPSNATPIRRG